MGQNNLNLPAANTPIKVSDVQNVVQAIENNIFARDSSGNLVDGQCDIGSQGTPGILYNGNGRYRNIHITGVVTVNGQVVPLPTLPFTYFPLGNAITNSPVDLYPAFLSPGGNGVYSAQVIASLINPIQAYVGQNQINLNTNVTISNVPAAWSGTNNTVLVNEGNGLLMVAGTTKQVSATIGEYGGWLQIDATDLATNGTNISNLDQKIVAFRVTTNASGLGEIMLAQIDLSNSIKRIIPILRGIGGTKRTILNNVTARLTLMAITYVFLSAQGIASGLTPYPVSGAAINNPPIWSADTGAGVPQINPYTAMTNDRWFSTTTGAWNIYNGSSWIQSNEVYLGYVLTGNDGVASGCTNAEYYDSDYFNSVTFDPFASSGKIISKSTSTIKISSDLIFCVMGNVLNIQGDRIVDVNITNVGTPNGVLAKNLDSATFAANSVIYVYVGVDGQFYTSILAPRKRNKAKGWYHPFHAYRCLTHVILDGSSHIIPFRHDLTTHYFSYSDATIQITNASAQIATQATPGITSSFSPFMWYIPPMVSEVQASVIGTTTLDQILEAKLPGLDDYTIVGATDANAMSITQVVFSQFVAGTTTSYNPTFTTNLFQNSNIWFRGTQVALGTVNIQTLKLEY